MTEYSLLKREEQNRYITMEDRFLSMRFYAFRGLMYVDITESEEPLVLGKRVLPNQWLLPSYFAGTIGNLRFETFKADENDYVWYEDFNTKFRLVAYSPDELKELEDSQ